MIRNDNIIRSCTYFKKIQILPTNWSCGKLVSMILLLEASPIYVLRSPERSPDLTFVSFIVVIYSTPILSLSFLRKCCNTFVYGGNCNEWRCHRFLQVTVYNKQVCVSLHTVAATLVVSTILQERSLTKSRKRRDAYFTKIGQICILCSQNSGTIYE